VQLRGRANGGLDDPNSQQFYHGTKADLKLGDLIAPGFNSNYGRRKKAAYVYFSAPLDAATWGAELAIGEGRGRIYVVKPTGPIEDDPNLTDKKYPGNSTKSYRTRAPLLITGEITDWQGHPPEALKTMKDNVERARRLGIEAVAAEQTHLCDGMADRFCSAAARRRTAGDGVCLRRQRQLRESCSPDRRLLRRRGAGVRGQGQEAVAGARFRRADGVQLARRRGRLRVRTSKARGIP
jgi:Rifampin ADP-ribosyl transferase